MEGISRWSGKTESQTSKSIRSAVTDESIVEDVVDRGRGYAKEVLSGIT